MSSEKQILFKKYQGCGNDFIILFDGTKQNRADLAKSWCNRHFGIGADGALWLEQKADAWRWDFFNADGSQAEMCGNAARCVGAILCDEGLFKTESIELETLTGRVRIKKIESNTFAVKMAKPQVLEAKKIVSANAETISGAWINSGVPHFCIETHAMDNELSKLKQQAQALRKVADFGEKGANITFWQRLSLNHIKSISFERGVEDFTQACGTGALASAEALLLHRASRQNSEIINVTVPGGELQVKASVQEIELIGPAVKVYNGSVSI